MLFNWGVQKPKEIQFSHVFTAGKQATDLQFKYEDQMGYRYDPEHYVTSPYLWLHFEVFQPRVCTLNLFIVFANAC